MDTQTVILVSASLGVAVVVFVVLRSKRTRAKLKFPGGVEVEVEGSGDPDPAIVAEDITSRAGGLRAADATGRGVHVKSIDAHGDVDISSALKGPSDPKA